MRMRLLLVCLCLATTALHGASRVGYVQYYDDLDHLLAGPRNVSDVAIVRDRGATTTDDGAIFYYLANAVTATNTTTVFEPSYGGRWLRSLSAINPDESYTMGALDVTGALTAGTIGTTLNVDIDTALAAKAASDILDSSSVGSLGVAGTNALADWNSIDRLMFRRFLASPIILVGDTPTYEIDWAFGLTWEIRGLGTTFAFTDINRPTGVTGMEYWGMKATYYNDGTLPCTISMPDGWESITRIWPSAVPPGDWVEIVFSYSGMQEKVYFDHQGPQAGQIPKVFGGSGNVYGIADFPEYASPTLTLSSLTNLFPDFSQGPLPRPIELSTNLFIGTPSGLTSVGRAVEIQLPVSNTNTTDEIRITPSDDWELYGFTNTFQVLPATNKTVLTLRSYGTTPVMFLGRMAAEYSGSGTSPAWVPGVLWDFESGSEPAGWNVAASTYDPLVNYGYAASPLIGTYSLAITHTNAAAYTVRAPTQTALDEVWVAFAMRVSASPSSPATFAEVLTAAASYRAYLRLSTSRLVTAHMSSGATLAHATAIPTSGMAYVKLRYKKGTGANAEVELWVMTDPSAGWGGGISRTDGTQTDQVAMWHFYNHMSFGSGKIAYYDQLVWSSEDIPASYFIGL